MMNDTWTPEDQKRFDILFARLINEPICPACRKKLGEYRTLLLFDNGDALQCCGLLCAVKASKSVEGRKLHIKVKRFPQEKI